MNNETQNPTERTEPDREHVLKATEAYWVETRLVHHPDSDGWSNTRILTDDSVEAVDGTKHAWEYECSCGEEFTGFETAATHLENNA